MKRISTRKLDMETKSRETLSPTSAVFDSSSDATKVRDELSLLGKKGAWLPRKAFALEFTFKVKTF